MVSNSPQNTHKTEVFSPALTHRYLPWITKLSFTHYYSWLASCAENRAKCYTATTQHQPETIYALATTHLLFH